MTTAKLEFCECSNCVRHTGVSVEFHSRKQKRLCKDCWLEAQNAMTFVCNKCGYGGPIQDGHPMPTLNGTPCPYSAYPAPELTPEERTRIKREFGIDGSSEGGK